MLGEGAAAKEKLENARALAASTSESRHKIITAALDTIKVREGVDWEELTGTWQE